MLTGCDKKVEMVRANSAEEVLNLFNTYNQKIMLKKWLNCILMHI